MTTKRKKQAQAFSTTEALLTGKNHKQQEHNKANSLDLSSLADKTCIH